MSAARPPTAGAMARRVLPSPLGPLTVSAVARGLREVRIGESHMEVGATEVVTDAEGIDLALAHLEEAQVQLAEYFAGERRHFTLPLASALEEKAPASFRVRVHRVIAGIPWGSALTYGEVAALAGSPRAVRAVGSACGANPLPIVVPCHRVLAAGGRIGGYTPGVALKRRLLALEGIEVR